LPQSRLRRLTWEYGSYRYKSSDRTGRAIDIDVLRRGQLRTFTVTPLERPAAKAA